MTILSHSVCCWLALKIFQYILELTFGLKMDFALFSLVQEEEEYYVTEILLGLKHTHTHTHTDAFTLFLSLSPPHS